MRSKSTVTVKRPANTTAYGNGDVVGYADVATAANAGSAILEFPQVGPIAGFIKIDSASLLIDAASIPAGMTTFRLYLYDAAPTAILDNAAWDLPAADRRGFVGYIDLGTVLDLGSTLYVQANNIGHRVKLAKASSSLYGLLVTAAGYTPGSGQVYSVTLHTSEP